MALKLKDILAKSKKIEFEHEGDKFEVEFNTGFYTPKLLSELVSGDKPSIDVQIEVLVNNITVWNITDDSGKMLTPTIEIFNSLGLALVNKIWTEMEKGIVPN